MPNYLALEWGRAGVRGLAADVSGDTIRVRTQFSSDWPADADVVNDPAALGLWLKTRLQALGLADCRLIVVLSREEFVLRLLGIPAANDDALPELVRYQTGARSSVPLDQLALDYLPLAAAPPQGGRWVQTATVPARLLARITSCATAAGLDLRAVGTSTIAIGEVITQAPRDRALPGNGQRLIVRCVGQQLEIALWRGQDLLFAHVARAADATAAAVEVQRALVSHQSALGDTGVGLAWVVAAPDCEPELQAALTKRLGCEVLAFDPNRDLSKQIQAADLGDRTADWMAALGALQATIQSTVPAVDFLKPRRATVKRDRTKVLLAALAGLLLVLLPTAYIASRIYVNSLAQRIAVQEATARRQEEQLAAGKPVREQVAFLKSWDQQRMNWLGQMQQMGGEMPGTERVYLDRWRFDLAPGEARGTTEVIGYARQRRDAERLTQRLAEQPGYRIQPNAIGAGGNDSEYPILYQLDAEFVAPSRGPARKQGG